MPPAATGGPGGNDKVERIKLVIHPREASPEILDVYKSKDEPESEQTEELRLAQALIDGERFETKSRGWFHASDQQLQTVAAPCRRMRHDVRSNWKSALVNRETKKVQEDPGGL